MFVWCGGQKFGLYHTNDEVHFLWFNDINSWWENSKETDLKPDKLRLGESNY